MMRRAALALASGARALSSAGPGSLQAAGAGAKPAAVLQAAAGAWQRSAARWSHCSCSGDLSLPPPQKVLVEYAPAEVDAFIAFADAVEEEFEGVMVDGEEVQGRPGAFDIKLEDGQTIFSAAGGAEASPAALPDYSDLFARLRQAGLQAATA